MARAARRGKAAQRRGEAGWQGRRGGEPQLSTEFVYRRLHHAILRGELKEGPISQVQLAKELGVSRTPLREAIRMLQREGLIDSEPNRRVRVTALSVDHLEQLYAARIVVDCLACRLTVPRLTGEDMRTMERLLSEMARLAEARDLETWDVHHRAYHELLKSRAGDRIERVARDLFDQTERYRHVYLAEPRAWSTAEQEHLAVFEACKRGDALAASSHLARHLGTTALTIIALVAPEHDPVPVRQALRMATAEGATSLAAL